MLDRLRRAVFPRRTQTTPAAAAAAADFTPPDRMPLYPPVPAPAPAPAPASAPASRPRLALAPVLRSGTSVPPRIGERAYFEAESAGCMAWEINGRHILCHFSAPRWFSPGPQAQFVGVVEKIDGVQHHVTGGRPFSAGIPHD